MITFEDLNNKYFATIEVMQSNRQVLDKKTMSDLQKSAPWINVPTLARWLYGSSTEFVQEFINTSNTYFAKQGSQELESLGSQRSANSQQRISLKFSLSAFKENIFSAFPNNPELREALVA
ncbi:MAG: hypothetical protein AABX66_00285 [Nanoarchaeota archaeon]